MRARSATKHGNCSTAGSIRAHNAKAKKQADKVPKESTFAAVAEEWFSQHCEQRSQSNKPLSQATIIKTQWLLNLAHRLIDRLERVFRYAVGTGRMQINPAAAFRDSADPRDKLPRCR